MTISFNQIPNARVPFVFVEFDTSRAQQGPSIQEYKSLLIGQRLAGGTKPAGQIDLVTSEDQAKKFYGAGSMLASMAKAYFADNKIIGLSCISLDDDGGANAATGTLTIGGSPTEAGTLVFKVAGRRYRVGVASSATPTQIGDDIVTEIGDDADAQVSAANVAGVVTFTHLNAGAAGNEIDLRTNPEVGDELPAGMTAVVVAFSGGTANPDISAVITAMGDTQYNAIAMPYTDAANLTLLENELADRFGPIRPIDGVAFSAKRDSFANLVTFGDGRNSPHVSTMSVIGPSNPWDWSANYAGVVSRYAQIDPARPFQTLAMTGVDGGDDSEVFDFSERDLLLRDGISTHTVDSGGVVRIERAISMNQENALGAPDTSLLDLNTLFTLSFLRFDLRNLLLLKFPRHKLGDDGNRFAPGQAILTPKIARAEIIARFRQWSEDLGLVENVDQFKRDLIVERNVSNPNQLDMLLSPDLINQFRQGAAQIGFLL